MSRVAQKAAPAAPAYYHGARPVGGSEGCSERDRYRTNDLYHGYMGQMDNLSALKMSF